MLWAFYADQPSHSMMVLAAVGQSFAGQNDARLRQQLDQSLRQQGMDDKEALVIENSYAKQYTIRGKLATFQITKGKGEKSHASRIEVAGSFQGKVGPAMLMLNADAEKVSEEEVVQMLESIK